MLEFFEARILKLEIVLHKHHLWSDQTQLLFISPQFRNPPLLANVVCGLVFVFVMSPQLVQ